MCEPSRHSVPAPSNTAHHPCRFPKSSPIPGSLVTFLLAGAGKLEEIARSKQEGKLRMKKEIEERKKAHAGRAVLVEAVYTIAAISAAICKGPRWSCLIATSDYRMLKRQGQEAEAAAKEAAKEERLAKAAEREERIKAQKKAEVSAWNHRRCERVLLKLAIAAPHLLSAGHLLPTVAPGWLWVMRRSWLTGNRRLQRRPQRLHNRRLNWRRKRRPARRSSSKKLRRSGSRSQRHSVLEVGGHVLLHTLC
jgi:hypothetical protein